MLYPLELSFFCPRCKLVTYRLKIIQKSGVLQIFECKPPALSNIQVRSSFNNFPPNDHEDVSTAVVILHRVTNNPSWLRDNDDNDDDDDDDEDVQWTWLSTANLPISQFANV